MVGEAKQVAGSELEVPFQVLPLLVGIPPFTGEWKRAVEVGDLSSVRTGQQGQRVWVASPFLTGDGDLWRRAEALER